MRVSHRDADDCRFALDLTFAEVNGSLGRGRWPTADRRDAYGECSIPGLPRNTSFHDHLGLRNALLDVGCDEQRIDVMV